MWPGFARHIAEHARMAQRASTESARGPMRSTCRATSCRFSSARSPEDTMRLRSGGVHIPKGDGSQTRPIGIPTFEDKLLQRAVVMVLESIWHKWLSRRSDRPLPWEGDVPDSEGSTLFRHLVSCTRTSRSESATRGAG